MIAKSTRKRIGAISANSTRATPRSLFSGDDARRSLEAGRRRYNLAAGTSIAGSNAVRCGRKEVVDADPDCTQRGNRDQGDEQDHERVLDEGLARIGREL